AVAFDAAFFEDGLNALGEIDFIRGAREEGRDGEGWNEKGNLHRQTVSCNTGKSNRSNGVLASKGMGGTEESAEWQVASAERSQYGLWASSVVAEWVWCFHARNSLGSR